MGFCEEDDIGESDETLADFIAIFKNRNQSPEDVENVLVNRQPLIFTRSQATAAERQLSVGPRELTWDVLAITVIYLKEAENCHEPNYHIGSYQAMPTRIVASAIRVLDLDRLTSIRATLFHILNMLLSVAQNQKWWTSTSSLLLSDEVLAENLRVAWGLGGPLHR